MVADIRDVPFDPAGMEYWLWARRDDFMDERQRLIVRDVLTRLPVVHRDTIDAVFYQRLSKREAARQLGVSRMTVERRIEAVGRLIRKALDAAM